MRDLLKCSSGEPDGHGDERKPVSTAVVGLRMLGVDGCETGGGRRPIRLQWAWPRGRAFRWNHGDTRFPPAAGMLFMGVLE